MKRAYVNEHLPSAQAAGTLYGMDPVVILAQGALESGWGRSELAREHNNFFGITGYGRPNAHWHGQWTELEEGGLRFRRYDSARQSFLDFGRLLRGSYPIAASLSHYPDAFAREIAYSRYICEANGDNREAYRKTLARLCREIRALL